MNACAHKHYVSASQVSGCERCGQTPSIVFSSIRWLLAWNSGGRLPSMSYKTANQLLERGRLVTHTCRLRRNTAEDLLHSTLCRYAVMIAYRSLTEATAGVTQLDQFSGLKIVYSRKGNVPPTGCTNAPITTCRTGSKSPRVNAGHDRSRLSRKT